MGYYSNFEISVHADTQDADEVTFDEFNTKFYSITDYLLSDEGEWVLNGVKWYRHDKDMKVLSRMWPEHVFTVYRSGEEDGDLETSYYLDGKCQTENATVTFLPFDRKKLQ